MTRRIPALLVVIFLWCNMAEAAFPVAENLSQTSEETTDIIVGRVISRTFTPDSSDPDWDKRTFTYEIEVEATEKGDFARGDTFETSGLYQSWIGEGVTTTEFLGHELLPLEGERARFFLIRQADGTVTLVRPTGVELASDADPTDPVRIGDPPRPVPEEPVEETEEKAPIDPFGWDIILILLGLPFLIGAIKQKQSSRWGLLVVACVMFIAAAIITLS